MHITFPITEDNYRKVKALLPRQVNELVELVGLKPTLLLLHHKAGQPVRVAQGLTQHGKARNAALAELIGQEAAEKMAALYATNNRTVYIPTCRAARVYLRNVALLSDFDRLTGQEGYTATDAVSELATRYHMTARSVWTLTKLPMEAAP